VQNAKGLEGHPERLQAVVAQRLDAGLRDLEVRDGRVVREQVVRQHGHVLLEVVQAERLDGRAHLLQHAAQRAERDGRTLEEDAVLEVVARTGRVERQRRALVQRGHVLRQAAGTFRRRRQGEEQERQQVALQVVLHVHSLLLPMLQGRLVALSQSSFTSPASTN